MPLKVKFTLRAEPSPTDSKTTVVAMHSMQFLNEDDDVNYRFPDTCRLLSLHELLFALPIASAAKRDLAPRWARRSFKITLPDAIAELYVDAEGNAVFNGKFLEEINDDRDSLVSFNTSSAAHQNSAPTPQPRSLISMTKDAVIPKFGASKSNFNADAWIEIFESECVRLEIPTERYWEVIRLFLEEGAEKWYNTTRLSSRTTSWEFWRNSFIENFVRTRFSSARFAFSYHFISGSLSDYIQNKLNLLVSFNPNMHELDKIAHVALGLPQHLQDQINSSETTSLGKLISVINSFDRPTARKVSSSPFSDPGSAFSSLRRSPCPYCKKKRF